MSLETVPVVAAIPNYNMGDSLGVLLPQILEQEYDGVIVLDDASTDHSREVAESFGGAVRFVAGRENLGPGGNRSRVLEVIEGGSLIHFLDADMRLESERTPEIARELLADPEIGFVGGLVRSPDGLQRFWNYGPRQCLQANLTGRLQGVIERVVSRDPELAASLRNRFDQLLEDWPNPFEDPEPRRTFWTNESNILIPSETFRRVGGYDPGIKNHEVQDLALKLHEAGLRREFNPLVATTHTAVIVRSTKRAIPRAKAEFKIARKHGLLNWLLPDGHFRPEA